MPRTAGTRTTRIGNVSPTGNYETQSDFGGGNFEDPKDISDVAGLDFDIGGSRGTPPRRPPMGGIDLGKGLDLEKPRPPRSAIGIEIGKSPSGNLGIGAAIPIPVPGASARGGIAIDPRTGQIRGGYGGIGIGRGPIGASIDIGVDTPPGSDKLGCFKHVTVTVGLFSHTYGKNECEPQPRKPPETSASLPSDPEEDPPSVAVPDTNVQGWVFVHCKASGYSFSGEYQSGLTYRKILSPVEERLPAYVGKAPMKLSSQVKRFAPNPRVFDEVIIEKNGPSLWVHRIPVYDSVGYFKGEVPLHTELASQYAASVYFTGDVQPLFFWGTFREIKQFLDINNAQIEEEISYSPTQYSVVKFIPFACIPYYGAIPSENFDPPSIPNLPPRKKMNDDCCKASLAIQLEILRLLGREIGPQGLVPQTTKKGFIGEEFERVKTPITDPTKPEKIKVKFSTVYELLMYTLHQSNNLDIALDPQSYKIPAGKLQNPAYNRDSEQSLKSNNQPDKDKAGNKRELEINKDNSVKIGGFLQQQQYVFDAVKRLEYLFPYGELSDALIAKSLLVPGAEGNIKIHNMIMAYELQMQYLDAALGNPREIITIKDANPAIEGDQPIEVRSLSISDLLRQNIKFHVDTGGDVDAAVNLILRVFRTVMANRLDIVKIGEATQALFEDTGMLEKQAWVEVHLEGDPYAGQWVKGQGFKPNPDLEKKTEEATEKVLRETIKPTEQKVKVSRRSKDEKTDMRDLIRGLADFMQRLLSIPSAGDVAKSIDKLIESAKFKVQTDMALIRQNVVKAATASRNRTKKRKK